MKPTLFPPSLLLLAAAALILAAAPAVPADDWPRWRGPQGNNISAETGWQAQFPAEGPRTLWTAEVGLGFSSVTVAQGRAYTVGNRDEKDTIYCFDAASGEVVWKHAYDHPLDAKYYGGGSSGTPTIDAGLVYTVSKRGHVHCLDATTGAVKWAKNLAEETKSKMPTWGFASSVFIDGQRAVINMGTHGVAFDKTTGRVLWTTGTAESGYATPVPFEQGGQRLYLIFAARDLVAVRADTGAKVWSHRWKTSYDVNSADPVVLAPNLIFLGSGYERGSALLDVSGSQPKVVWENKNLRPMLNAPVALGDHLYGIDGNTGKAQLRCVEARSGEVVWTFPDTGHGALTAANGHLIVISENGELLIGRASPQPFAPLARAQVSGGTFWTVPVLAQGRLYLRNGDGRLTCLDLRGTRVASAH